MLEALLLGLVRDCLFLLGHIAGRSSFLKPLSSREEAECIRAMRAGDEDARRRLIEHNMRLVAHIARKYKVPGHTPDDLVSIGAIGLIKAVGSFKPESGTSLSTFAARCIENEVLMCLRASRKQRADVSLFEPIGTDGEGNEVSFADILGTPADAVEEEVTRRVTLQGVRATLDTLPHRERVVLQMRYGLLDGQTHPQSEIAEILGISRSYVSRVEKHGIALLRAALMGETPP